MILSFHPCFDSDVQIIIGDRSLDQEDLALIGKADVIILPQSCSPDLYNICAISDAHIFPEYKARFQYPGKVGQARLFKKLALPHPVTLCWKRVNDLKDAFKKDDAYPHKIPFLIKDNYSHEGDGIYFVKEKSDLPRILDGLSEKKDLLRAGFISQDFVPCSGNALRVVIFGNKMISYWKRPMIHGEVITTISRGAGIDHDWRPDLQEKGKAQARVVAEKTGINLAALDFIFPDSDKKTQPLILEINYYFGRRGLGGIDHYYRLLYTAIRDWLEEKGLNPNSVKML